MQARSKNTSSILLSDIQKLEGVLNNRLRDEKKEADLRIKAAQTQSDTILLKAQNEAIAFQNETYQLLIDRLNQSTSLTLEQAHAQVKRLNQAADHLKKDWLSFMLAFVTGIHLDEEQS